jgi:glycosyltransferase involved in cell wall biosynthesis
MGRAMSRATSRPGIVCFAKDWNEDPTSNHHVMQELARTHEVLWLNSIATRTPNLQSGRDLKKIVRKVGAFARGPVRVADHLWVYTPLVLPFPHNPAARAVNQGILRLTVGALRAKLGMREFELWTFLPNAGDYLGMGESLAVYYCTDEWSLFSYIDDSMLEEEHRLCEKVDVVFAVNAALVERKRAKNPETHLATHGVEHAQFAAALDDATPVPADLAALPRPVLGFYGTLQDWVDFDLLAELARRRPAWSFALLGGVHVDIARFATLANVHFLGRKPHPELPAYCKGFDVGLIPYAASPRLPFINPIKLREYLSAGLPVVSTPLPEVMRYAEHCAVAADADGFEAAILTALQNDNPARRRARSAAMREETWQHKVAAVRAAIDRIRVGRTG